MESKNSFGPPTVLDTTSSRAVGASMWLATLVMLALLVLIVVNAALRSASGTVIPGAYEMGQVAMPILVFLALPWTFFRQKNYKLDLFYALFPDRGKQIVDLLHTLLYLAIAVVWGYGTILEAIRSIGILDYIPGSLKVPVYPARIVIGLGCLLILLVLVRELMQRVKAFGGTRTSSFDSGVR